jgi:fucose 4-O-acetylase-like acetyltransferase
MAATARARTHLDGIDFIKAAAIVAVVATHSGINVFYPTATVWDRVLTATWVWFQVPAFLVVSGFLYSSERPVSLREVAGRLARILIPYVLASVFMQLVGAAPVDGLRQALFQIASASALGPYYFIAYISFCTLMVWPLSRLDRRGAAGVLAALFAWAVAPIFWPALQIPASPLWQARNPLEMFVFGYFVLGWVAAQHREWLALRLARHRLLIGIVASAGVTFWFASQGTTFNLGLNTLYRILFTLSMLALILVVTHGRRAPRAVVFLSTATLAIYLYHLAPQIAMTRWVMPWPPPLRILFQFALGIASGCLLAFAGRRVLGAARARRYLGA